MPTFDALPRFLREYAKLTKAEREQFHLARAKFVQGLRSGQMAPGLRLGQLTGHPGVYELTWAPDGRATFTYGDEVRPGERHVIWRRIGGHEIFDEP